MELGAPTAACCHILPLGLGPIRRDLEDLEDPDEARRGSGRKRTRMPRRLTRMPVEAPAFPAMGGGERGA